MTAGIIGTGRTQYLTRRFPGMSAKDGVTLVDTAAEGGVRVIQLPPHPGKLRPLARKEKSDMAPRAQRCPGRNRLTALVTVRQSCQLLLRLRRGGSDNGQAMVKMATPGIGRVAHI